MSYFLTYMALVVLYWSLVDIGWPIRIKAEHMVLPGLGVFVWFVFQIGFGWSFCFFLVGTIVYPVLLALVGKTLDDEKASEVEQRSTIGANADIVRTDHSSSKEYQTLPEERRRLLLAEAAESFERRKAEHNEDLERRLQSLETTSSFANLSVDARAIVFCQNVFRLYAAIDHVAIRSGATIDEWIGASRWPLFAISYIRYVEGRFRSKYEELKAKEQRVERAITALAEQILNEHEEKVERFYEIAYRKTVATDEYGDEDAEALNREIPKLISKLKFESENFAKFTDGQSFDKRQIEDKITQILADRFKVYYLEQKSVASTVSLGQLQDMSGTDFEHYVVGLLKEAGAADARPTAGSGDQGADVLFSFNGLKIVVQTKRHSKPVGNKAIQEVYAAKAYYKCDVAWAISSSTFTDSARRLARETGVHLFEGVDLPRFNERFAEFFKTAGRKRVG